jgi:ankyrin repeat protein
MLDSGAAAHGVLHLMAKRNDVAVVRWLLEHGADPNARWAHWDAEVTPLHGQSTVVFRRCRTGARS